MNAIKDFSNIRFMVLYEVIENFGKGDIYFAVAKDGCDLRSMMLNFGIDTDKCEVKIILPEMPTRLSDYQDVSTDSLVGELARRGWSVTIEHKNGRRIEVSFPKDNDE